MGRPARTRKGSYTWDDFVALPDDDRRELIDGELVEVEVVPGQIHEFIVLILGSYLVAYARRRGGRALASGYTVRVSDRRGVMPDIQYFARGNEPDESQDSGLADGRPDVAVEILSPSSRRYDRIVKLEYYAAIKVPEYWIVDPKKRTLHRLVLTKKGYAISAVLEGDATFAPKEFPGLKIPLGELWTMAPKKK
jgi:Uma2 family endonuclease